jgi:hypothetical protein
MLQKAAGAHCRSGPNYTDLKKYDVDTSTQFSLVNPHNFGIHDKKFN